MEKDTNSSDNKSDPPNSDGICCKDYTKVPNPTFREFFDFGTAVIEEIKDSLKSDTSRTRKKIYGKIKNINILSSVVSYLKKDS